MSRRCSVSNASSSTAAGTSASDLFSTSHPTASDVYPRNHITTSSNPSPRKKHGKEKAHGFWRAGVSASEDLHSTMTERVFKIRCSERVQVDKSTSAFSSILRKANPHGSQHSPSKAALSGHKARKSLSGQWDRHDGSTRKGKDRPSVLRLRGNSSNNGISPDNIPPRSGSGTSYQWREVILEAHVDATPPKICVFERTRPLHTFDPTDLDCDDVYMPSSSLYSEIHPHVLVIRKVKTSRRSKTSATSSSSPQSTPQGTPTSPLRASFSQNSAVTGFRHRSSSFANSLFPSSSSSAMSSRPLAALGLSEGRWQNQESAQNTQGSASSNGSGEAVPLAGAPLTSRSSLRRHTSTFGDSRPRIEAVGEDLHLSFPTANAVQAWYTLLQAFASVPEESNGGGSTALAHGYTQMGKNAGYDVGSSAVSLSSTSSHSAESALAKRVMGYRSWSQVEISSMEALNLRGAAEVMDREAKLFCEIYVDNDLRARSYPLACSNPNGSVHWSERFSLEQAWHIRNCHIIIRIIDRNGLVSDFGTADIDYARLIQQQTPGDCRIYITPLGGGEVLGDLRLELRYIELKIERKVKYDKVWKTLSEPSRRSHLTDLAAIPGGPEAICRAGTALNKLDELLFSLMEEDVVGPSSTLFRSNTLFTRLLDTTMRLHATEFLQKALANVITDVLELELELEIDPTRIEMECVDEKGKELRMWVERLWGDIYLARDKFPLYLRKIFARLTEAVERSHPNNDKIKQRAISSFIFLRLIAPALMWPHLYNLSTHPPPPNIQRSLTSLAKPILNLAFGVEDRGKEMGMGWGKEEGEGMRDFLRACSTEMPESPSPSSIQLFLSSLPYQAILHPSIGHIDLDIQLSLLDRWSQGSLMKRKVPERRSSSSWVSSRNDDGIRDGEHEELEMEEESRLSGESFETALNTTPPLLFKSPRLIIPSTTTSNVTTTATATLISPRDDQSHSLRKMEPRDARIGRIERDRKWVDGVLVDGSREKGDEDEDGDIRRRESDEIVDLAEAIRSLPIPLPSQIQPLRPTIPPRYDSRLDRSIAVPPITTTTSPRSSSSRSLLPILRRISLSSSPPSPPPPPAPPPAPPTRR